MGGILGTMLLGLSVLTVRFHIAPEASQTVLSQITGASVGRGPIYYVVDLSTTAILAIAANTSFGGLPVLASLFARGNLLPRVFGLRGDRPVYRYGVVVLALLAGALLVAVDANTTALIPLFAIGVFTGFTLSQTGLVRHWHHERPRRWWARAGLNGLGAAMTAVATVIFVVTKFSAGAWVVVIAVPALILLFPRIDAYYRGVATEIGLGTVPPAPAGERSLVVVAVTAVSKMTAAALTTALSLADEVVAVSVQFDDEGAASLRADWDRWDPGVPLTVLRPALARSPGPCSPTWTPSSARAIPRCSSSSPRSSPGSGATSSSRTSAASSSPTPCAAAATSTSPGCRSASPRGSSGGEPVARWRTGRPF